MELQGLLNMLIQSIKRQIRFDKALQRLKENNLL